jgi:aryl sulfotransferase
LDRLDKATAPQSLLSPSDLDEQIRRDRSAIREVLDAKDRIFSCLSTREFDGIGEEELVILYSVRRNIALHSILDLASEFGMTGEMIAEVSTRMLSCGYLELRRDSKGSGRPRIVTTRQGREVCDAIQYSVEVKRWADLPVREGDIVISTVPKSGTTWMQMICSLLIFQTPDLPVPLQQLSPWLEWPGHKRDDIFAELASQNHRRFIKTHMRLSELPIDSRVMYIAVGRHPLDAALSFINSHIASEEAGNGRGIPPAHNVLREWVDRETSLEWKNIANPEGFTLSAITQHLSDAWERRNEPNILLFHYEQLSEDLEGEMRRLAACLGITVPGIAWPDLVKAATFTEMRASASRLQPVSGLADPAAFFHGGKSGRGRELLDDPVLDHYHERMERLAKPDLVAWLHRQCG